MANVDSPRGFEPIGHLAGGEIRTMEFTLTTGQRVYKGDMLKGVAGGTVQVAAAGNDADVIGIAAEYVYDSDSDGGMKVKVWVDPNIIFKVQSMSGQTPALTDVFGTADINTYATGNNSTYLSITELAAISTGAAAEWLVIGKVDSPDNAWGEHVKLKVVRNEGFFSAGSTGI